MVKPSLALGKLRHLSENNLDSGKPKGHGFYHARPARIRKGSPNTWQMHWGNRCMHQPKPYGPMNMAACGFRPTNTTSTKDNS